MNEFVKCKGKIIINLEVHETGKYLSVCMTDGFQRRIQLHAPAALPSGEEQVEDKSGT
jgi:hypothetical protein